MKAPLLAQKKTNITTENAINFKTMIEIEKKFLLNEGQKQRLLQGAEFVGEKVFTDTYFDNANFSLALEDIWLREREERFELKLPMPKMSENEMINKYHEIEGEQAIRQIFQVPIAKSFQEDIAAFGHKPFCTFKTTRQKYSKDGFSIDLDEAEFESSSESPWKYALCEIELMVESSEQMSAAEEKIYAFAREHGLEIKHVRGKLVEFFYRKKPETYQKLLTAGVIKE